MTEGTAEQVVAMTEGMFYRCCIQALLVRPVNNFFSLSQQVDLTDETSLIKLSFKHLARNESSEEILTFE